MTSSVQRWIAATSLLLLLPVAHGARRPVYGGMLHVEMRAQLHSLDPADAPLDAGELTARALILPLIHETLVYFDEHGRVQSRLAAGWSHVGKSWVFSLRAPIPGATLQREKSFADSVPLAQILREQARVKNAIVARSLDGSAVSSAGPFLVESFEPGKSLVLTANESYHEGRPFLDAIEFQFGREVKDQALDMTLGRANVTEGTESGGMAMTSTLALVFEPERVPTPVREALSLSLDRLSLQKVLARSGEPAYSILPQSLSGYAQIFIKGRDLTRAKAQAAGAMPLTLSFDPADAFVRRIAERIILNAADAGLRITSANGKAAAVRLERLPITINNEFAALEDIAELQKLPVTGASAYDLEKSILETYTIIPVVHLPAGWSVTPKVHNWPDLPNVWIEPTGIKP